MSGYLGGGCNSTVEPGLVVEALKWKILPLGTVGEGYVLLMLEGPLLAVPVLLCLVPCQGLGAEFYLILSLKLVKFSTGFGTQVQLLASLSVLCCLLHLAPLVPLWARFHWWINISCSGVGGLNSLCHLLKLPTYFFCSSIITILWVPAGVTTFVSAYRMSCGPCIITPVPYLAPTSIPCNRSSSCI